MTRPIMSRRSQLLLFLVVSLFCHKLLGQAEASNGSELTLSQALSFALKNAPELQSQVERLRISKLQAKNARGVLWPSLALRSVIGGQGGAQTVSGSQGLTSSSIGLSVNLLNSGRDWTSYQVANLSESLAEIQSQDAVESYGLQIYQAFVTYSRMVALIEIAEQRAAVLADQFNRVRKSYRAGSKARGDYLRFSAQQKRAQIGLDRARSDLKLAQDEIKRLLGMNLIDHYRFQPLPVKVDITSVNDLEPIAIENHFSHRMQRIQIEIEKESLEQSKFNLLPTASVDAGLFQNYGTAFFSEDLGQGWQASLSLSYDLFDFGQNRRDLQISRSQLNIAEATLRDTDLILGKQIAALKINIELALSELKLSHELLEIDTTTFNRVSTQYQRGQASYLEYIEALDNILQARSSVIENSYNYRERLAEWKYHQGKIYATYANE